MPTATALDRKLQPAKVRDDQDGVCERVGGGQAAVVGSYEQHTICLGVFEVASECHKKNAKKAKMFPFTQGSIAQIMATSPMKI